ncbi:ABC transporter permease [Rhodoblastus acidophilus]|uniref:ABC transporter permease n=1 Tax=Rhodoblastus acidophilus TaxID=1074 RepID=A0A6N8DHD0_RHOAC|nr:ABC transporter permease [Rhodoblastus acidophilus]MCW2272595.1 ABC-2 type transport system permease protein [Rhodoblastus acidophilus]MTV29508.1 ABC transporter permease [Rhodoblastus acidophilus]
MILSMMRVMFLDLLRDRGALVMAFVLPAAIYLIFASIFSGTGGEKLQLSVAVLDQAEDGVSRRLVSAIAEDPRLFVAPSPSTRAGLERAIRRGDVDAGIVIRGDPVQSAKEAPILVLGDTSRPVAAPVVAGRLQKILGETLPDVVYRRNIVEFDQNLAPLTPQQRMRAEAAAQAIEKAVQEKGAGGRLDAPAPMVELALVARSSQADAPTVYYAGAVGVLFLLISAGQGAMLLIDERRNNILDRLTSSAGGLAKVVGGKFLFLTLQGTIQVGIIFLVAAALYGVAVMDRVLSWSLVTLAAAAMAAGAALLLCALCRTRQQAQTLSAFLVLMVSAVGGSMIPRYLMPRWLQDVSMLTPNAWAIEAYQDLLWRDADGGRAFLYAAMLVGVGLVAMTFAWAFLLRERRS